MADLSSDLQNKIEELGLKHTALVEAVRGYSNGSVAASVNDTLLEAENLRQYLKGQEAAMMSIALQQYTGSVPAMVLDFKEGVYLQGVRKIANSYWLNELGSFVRDGVTTSVNGSGILTTQQANQIPFAFDPETGANKGIQVDPESTNLLDSSNINSTDWKTVESSLQYGKPSPDGGYSAVKVIPDSGAGQGSGRVLLSNAPTLQDDEVYTVSSFLKADGVTSVELKSWGGDWHYGFGFNLETGNVYGISLGTYGNIRAFSEKYPNGWWRVSITFKVNPSGDGTVNLQHASRDTASNDGTKGFHVWGAQLEKHHTSTSLIPTAGTPVTRPMDHTYFSLGEMYNQATKSCSMVVEFWWDPNRNTLSLDEQNGILFGFTADDGFYTPQRKAVAINSTGDLCLFWATNTLKFTTQPTEAGFVKVAITTNGNRTYWYLNGVQHPSWKDELPTGPIRISFMSDRNNNNALTAPTTYIRSVKYYPFELSQSEAEELSS